MFNPCIEDTPGRLPWQSALALFHVAGPSESNDRLQRLPSGGAARLHSLPVPGAGKPARCCGANLLVHDMTIWLGYHLEGCSARHDGRSQETQHDETTNHFLRLLTVLLYETARNDSNLARKTRQITRILPNPRKKESALFRLDLKSTPPTSHVCPTFPRSCH